MDNCCLLVRMDASCVLAWITHCITRVDLAYCYRLYLIDPALCSECQTSGSVNFRVSLLNSGLDCCNLGCQEWRMLEQMESPLLFFFTVHYILICDTLSSIWSPFAAYSCMALKNWQTCFMCHIVLSLVLFGVLPINLISSHILILIFLPHSKSTGFSCKISAIHDLRSCKGDDCGWWICHSGFSKHQSEIHVWF